MSQTPEQFAVKCWPPDDELAEGWDYPDSEPLPEGWEDTNAASGFCPHGFVLAENICAPCSEGRKNFSTSQIGTVDGKSISEHISWLRLDRDGHQKIAAAVMEKRDVLAARVELLEALLREGRDLMREALDDVCGQISPSDAEDWIMRAMDSCSTAQRTAESK
jgi:hypothetical protein